MPIYEYRCDACGETTERLQARAEEAAPLCSRCGAAMKRMLSVFAVPAPRTPAPGPCGSSDCACRR